VPVILVRFSLILNPLDRV